MGNNQTCNLCFSPKNMNDYDTPLWEDKYVVA